MYLYYHDFIITNEFKLIKYKLTKYIFIGSLILLFFILGLIIRLSFKPFDVGFVTKYIDQNVLESIIPFDNLENASLRLNLINNSIILNFKNIENFKFDKSNLYESISVKAAQNIGFSLNAIKLLKKQFELNYININEAKIIILLDEQSLNPKQAKFNIKTNNLPYSLKKIELTNSELELNTLDKKQKINLSNLNFKILNEDEKIRFSNIEASLASYYNLALKFSLQLKEPILKTSDKGLSLNAKSLDLLYNGYMNNFDIINNKKKEIKFKNIKLISDKEMNFFMNMNLMFNNDQIPLELNGNLSDQYNLDTIVKAKFKDLNFPGEFLKKNNTINNSFLIKNSKNILVNGEASLKIFQNKFLASNFNFELKNKNYFSLIFKGLDLKVKDITLKGNILENQLEIEEGIINTLHEQIILTSKTSNLFNDPEVKIEVKIKTLNLMQFEEAFHDFINNNPNNNFKVSKFKISEIENVKLKLDFNKNKFLITGLEGELLKPSKIFLEDNLLINFNYASFNKVKPGQLSINIPELNLMHGSDQITLEKNVIQMKDQILNNFSSSLAFNGSIRSDFKKLIYFLNSRSELNSINIKDYLIEGKIDAKVDLFYTVRDKNKLNYKISGQLKKLNFSDKEKSFPIVVENFNGEFLMQEKKIDIIGLAKINKSSSKIKLKLENNSKLSIDINADALASSFDFLEEYNFLKSGIAKINLKIIKDNIFNKEWAAEIQGNLYNNNIKINEILYEKDEKKLATLKAKYLFYGETLKRVEGLTLISEDIILRGNIYLENGSVKKIEIKELLRELDNFSATLSFKEKNEILLDIFGNSINMNNYFDDDARGSSNGKINLNVKNFYFNTFNLGEVKLSSNLKNNKIRLLSGNIYYNKIDYINFKYLYENNKYSEFKFNFSDFGLFLQKLNLSDKFINGKGSVILNIENNSKNIYSGNFIIKNFSIKDASFLTRLLQLASFTGLLEIIASEGIPFTNLEGSFIVDQESIIVEDTRFEGVSLGASTKGSINLEKKELDLFGVLIPAYAINNVINKIPLLGKVITGIEGEGIIGFDYTAKGLYNNPEYSVNPFSVLKPGILRSIFKNQSENSKDKNDEISK